MQPENTQNGPSPKPQNLPYSGVGAEKVIKPLNQNLPNAATPNVVSPTNPVPTPNNSIYPENVSHNVPTLDLKESAKGASEFLSVRHKSLMGLAIVGLISTFFLTYLGFKLNGAIAQSVREGKNIGGAQIFLYGIWVSVAIGFAMNVYFLFAKQKGTVALLLKIMLVIELISLLFDAIGIGGSDITGFILNGGYAIYIFVVLNIIRTEPAT